MKAKVKSNQNLLRDRAKVQIDSLAESKGRYRCELNGLFP